MTFSEHMWEGHLSPGAHCVLTALFSSYLLQSYPQPPDSGQKTLDADAHFNNSEQLSRGLP